MSLSSMKCEPCKVGAPKLTAAEIIKFLKETPGWSKEDNPDKITKEFEFKDFAGAINFINKVAGLAESEGHHPNIYLHDYKFVKIELWTHKIGGLHQNDFIMASKIGSIK